MTGQPPANGRALDLPALLAANPNPLDQLRLAAAVDVLERCDARSLTYGHNRGDGWWASLVLRGARITAEHCVTAADAFRCLVDDALTGARCNRCGRLIAPNDGPVVKYGDRLHNGETFTAEQAAAAAGVCRWRRFATRWIGECTAPVPRPAWKPVEPTTPPPYGVKRWSHLALADAVAEAGADVELIALVAAGYFHGYRSPLDMPEAALMGALTTAGLHELAAAVLAGEYAADPEERLPGQARDRTGACHLVVNTTRLLA